MELDPDIEQILEETPEEIREFMRSFVICHKTGRELGIDVQLWSIKQE